MARLTEEHAAGPALMPSLRATAIVGLGSVATLGMSVVTMKAIALLVGPAGLGLWALLHSILNLGVILIGFGLATSAIGAVAAAVARGGASGATNVERAASALSLAGGLLGAAVLLLVRGPMAEAALGSADRQRDVLILAPTLLLTTAAGVQAALLTGHHRIKAVTAVSVGTSLAAVGLGIPLIALWGLDGVAPALLIASLAQISLSLWFRRAGRHGGPPWSGRLVREARRLLRGGLPVAGSQLASSGATYLIPLIVLQVLGQTDVGLYRAAAAISIGYLAFFLAGLTQDYLPRLSAAASEADLGLLVERRMRLVMGLGAPIILGLLAVGPWLVEFLYSSDFSAAWEVLRWQLIGDLLRLPGWILAFVLLARRTRTYMATELIIGVALVAVTVAGLEWLGLAGAGLAYMVSQAAYLVVVWLVVRRSVPIRPGRLQLVLVLLAAASAALLAVDIRSLAGLLLFGSVALLLAAVAWPRMYRLHQRGEL